MSATARANVLRPRTAGYDMGEQDSKVALKSGLDREFAGEWIPVKKLYDPERNEGDTEPINGIDWKMYRSKRGFDLLFWKYWSDIGEKWKRGDQNIGAMEIRNDLTGKVGKVECKAKPMRKGIARRKNDALRWGRAQNQDAQGGRNAGHICSA